MNDLRVRHSWLSLLACLLSSLVSRAAGPAPTPVPARSPAYGLLPLLQDLPEPIQKKARQVIEKPAMYARGPAESFRCQPQVYHWLLDHPDRAVKAWLKLGAKCMLIADRGDGRFGCKDNQGTDVVWRTILEGPTERVWYAEGVVRPGLLLPTVGVKALFVIHLTEGKDSLGRTAIHHQAELVLHCDSKAASLATRILGASAPQLAEQYVGQIQTFFAALAWYLNEHPEKTQTLLGE